MRAILHIGTQKTGTTALQEAMASNAETLHERGVLFPVTGRKFGSTITNRHIGLGLAMSAADSRPDRALKRLGLRSPEAQATYRRRFRGALNREMEESQPETVLFSDEVLFLSADDDLIGALAEFLNERFETVHVACFLRHPVHYVRSFLSQQAKVGGLVTADLRENKWFQSGLYLHNLKRWARHFSAEQISVEPLKDSLISQIGPLLGGVELTGVADRKTNASLTELGFWCLLELNRRYPGGTRPSIVRHLFEETMTGAPFKLPPEVEQSVWEMFELEREPICREFIRSTEDRMLIHKTWLPGKAYSPYTPPDQETVNNLAAMVQGFADRLAWREDVIQQQQDRIAISSRNPLKRLLRSLSRR